jgi:hypothetical protein
MPYTINKYNGAVVTTVADGTIDSSTDLKFIGKNYAGYGEVQNENFLFLLENFASTSPPPRPLPGQIWYDSGARKLKFFDETITDWRTTGGAEIGGVAPTGLTTGDFWYDTINKQLYAWDGVDDKFELIGPQGVAGSATTQMQSKSVRDTLGGSHAVILAYTAGQVTFVISPDAAFTLDPVLNAITGFTKIQKGITLAYTNNDAQLGQTQTEHRFWGTASNADRLGGFPASDFIRSTGVVFNQLVQFGDVGFTVGEVPKLRVFNSGNTTPTIQNNLNDTIVFQTTSLGVTCTPLTLVGHDMIPGADGGGTTGTTIGSSTKKLKGVYAYNFYGVASQATTLAFPGAPGSYASASSASSPNTIVARNGDSDIFARLFQGVATSANYADLAEKYLADAEYEVGTVVAVGGEKEVTASSSGQRALGTVSANPAYMMNSQLEGGTYIALKGRVPVKVAGVVKKGDQMIAGDNGTAVAGDGSSHNVFAIALESSDDVGIKLIECVVL